MTALLPADQRLAYASTFKALGGPDGLEHELRRLGDRTTEVDRIEPGLDKTDDTGASGASVALRSASCTV